VVDDVAVKDDLYTPGHRGVANTVLIEKLVGAAPTTRWKPALNWGRLNNLGHSIGGIALSACTVPAAGQPSFEPCRMMRWSSASVFTASRVSTAAASPRSTAPSMKCSIPCWKTAHTAARCASGITSRSVAGSSADQTALQNGDRVIALVNNLGATPLSELYGVYNRLAQRCRSGIVIERNLIGSYCTSLDMAGFSITLLKADDGRWHYGTPRSTPRAELGKIRSTTCH
jgi:dihydroxyacetone kinase-like protein